jgi:homoserine kinase type II
MGIKTAITQDMLPLKYRECNLTETADGVNHSVYLLDDKYVLKLLENTYLETIKNEQKLLIYSTKLYVPQIIDIYEKEQYYMVFYTQIRGKSIYQPKTEHIKQIALFLKSFHSISKNINSLNEKIYTNDYLQKAIQKANHPTLSEYFDTIQCELKNDGTIHGDLFCDNAKFVDDNLSGVYDFMEACEGDFIFELAVVTIAWCFEDTILNKEKVHILLKTYGLDLSFDKFKEYIKFALLYYTTQRYLNNRDYKQLLAKLENL